jgi:hypothetical protein
MSNRVYIKTLTTGDLFTTDASNTLYRAERVLTEGGVTGVTYVVEGTGIRFDLTKPARSMVTKIS